MRSTWNAATIVIVVSILLVGCGGPKSHPGVWIESEIEAKIKDKMRLDQIDLLPNGGGFTGSGKNVDGESFKIDVKQDAAAKRLDYDAKGDRGSNEEGFFEVD